MKGIRISPGFWVLVLWFGAVNGWRLLGIVLAAAFVHELGHCLVLVLMGARITGLRLGVLGAVLETDSSRLSYARELLAALAGPGANLTAAWLLGRVPGASAASGAHLVLALFNLLPVWPLDGGRALALAVAWIVGPEAADQAVRWAGGVSALALAVALTALMAWSGGSLWLLPAACGLLTHGVQLWKGEKGWSGIVFSAK